MVTRIGGTRRKTRYLLKKNHRNKGKLKITNYLQEFELGTKVALVLDPTIKEGVFFRRFHGKIGVIKRKQGFCYVVEVRDGNKIKEVIAHPAHLRLVNA